MVQSTLDGLTDEQLNELEAQQGQPEITTGLVDRLAAAPAPTEGFTDQQLDALPVLASTPFARERGIALPPEAPAEPEPMTDYELNQLEEENYRRVDYIMPPQEFRQYWTRRKEENNEVGRFINGVGQGAAGMLAMIPEAGREIRDGMVGMVTDPVNQVQRNVQTGAEIIRKGGINMVQLFDWVGNKANDAATWAQRRGLKRQALAKQLEQQGRLTGDELRDAEIIATAASEADAMEPAPLEEEEDFGKAYERYQREKALEQEFAGVTNFQIGASRVGSAATSKDAYQITDEQPAETLSMLGSMAVDPVNLLPVGAGALSKLRVLRRTATLAGAPLRGVQRAADATADLAERAEFGISSRVQDITGLTAKQQAALGAGAAGAAVYADQAGGGGNFTTAVTAIGSVLPGLRYGGAIIRKTGAAAGGAATIIREAGVGGIGTARAEAAADLARMTAIPERYRKYFTGYVDGTDSTLKRVAQDAGNPEALRRVARFADRAGVTTAARLADDVTSGAVAAGITGAPFAALQPDAERAGEVFGGIMALGGAGGLVGSSIGRRSAAPDADVARMMADVYAVGGNVDALSALPHATLDRMAAMQGVLSSKVDFVPLKADEYRMNKDVSATGGELAAGLFLEKDANGRARVFINLDARKSAGGVDAIAPHEIGHAILTSNVLDGQPRNDLRNLVNQQYGPDGVQARGREYVTRLVDGDIQNGTTGELPQVLTEQEFRDLESGNKSAADISKARKLEPSERERLINERYEELSQRSIERGEDALDWARDEIIAETFASEAPAIDFRAIRRDAAFPRLAESMLATGGRVLEMMGVNLDSGTGKMLDNPSVLFRDNPLFQDRIMQKRVKEYVRAYDQFLTGLEEAGSATPRGVELARSSRPEDMARSTHVKLRDEGRGVLENDFLFQKPDGTYAYKPQPIINAAEANRAAQIKTLYDAKKFVPVNSTEFGKRKVNGREVIGGPVLPPQFDLFTHFPKHVREQARMLEAGREDGSTYYIDYNRIGTGASGRYRILNMGNVRAIQTESSAPFGWLVSKANHLLAAGIDINAFRASAMKAINKGELGIFNNDMKQVEADLKTYLANHRNGMPGEATIGQQKRDTLNGLIGTGTAVQRAANPLYAELNPKGSIRTWRIDRLNDAQPSGRTGYFFDYDKINNNRMPQQIPREAQGMPDAAAKTMAEQADAVDLGGVMVTPTARNIGIRAQAMPDAYHGTPYEVDRFSTEKIGTGEGAQAYGWGLYFAEARDVAQKYAAMARPKETLIAPDGNKFRATYKDRSGRKYDLGVFDDEYLANKALYEATGNVYKVRIKADDAELLDWDKPLSEQGEKVRKILGAWQQDYRDKNGAPGTYYIGPEATGEQIYKEIVFTESLDGKKRDGGGGGEAGMAASSALYAAGIKGIRYTDQFSRGATTWIARHPQGGMSDFPTERQARDFVARNPEFTLEPPKPTYNYVVFDESLIEITERNGQRVPLKKAAKRNAPRGQAMPDAAPADAPPFYMKSAQVLDSKIQGKAATADQVRAILKNPQNGIRAEELKWTGIEQAVERIAKENGGKVPKEALLRYLQEDGAVRLEEVRMGEQTLPVAEIRQMIDRGDRIDVYDQNHSRMITYDELGFYGESERLTVRGDKTTRYGQYQLPGGENYREVVLAMPASNQGRFIVEGQGAYVPVIDTTTGQAVFHGTYGQATDWANKNNGASYTSSHFDTPNYVAHMRLNERTDAAGKPGLFLEEIQSDRHQAGREKGYAEQQVPTSAKMVAKTSSYMLWDVFDQNGKRMASDKEAPNEKSAIASVSNQLSEGVSDAPFRKDWPTQMFKRALADAVSSGKEWIGWTTGETQAARYDLSKQVDSIELTPQAMGGWGIEAVRRGESVISETVADDKALAGAIGKDLAKKAVDDAEVAGTNETLKYSGLDLKVGGEGMKGFYDQILPKEISKYVKQWGGQVEKGSVSAAKDPSITSRGSAERAERLRRTLAGEPLDLTPIWRVNITPQMREGIKKAGQALFVGGMAAVVAEQEE
jgi:hypothetical protein